MDKIISSLPELDLSYMLQEGFAVLCSDAEDAEILIRCMLERMPECMLDWNLEDIRWKDEAKIYTLWARRYGGWGRGPSNHLMQGPYARHADDGYTIVPLKELIVIPDINESDIPIDFLLS